MDRPGSSASVSSPAAASPTRATAFTGAAVVDNPAADQIRAIRGRLTYIVEAVPEGVRWRRTYRFHTTDPAGGEVYVAFMREFFPGLTESLRVYMDLVREHVERLAEQP